MVWSNAVSNASTICRNGIIYSWLANDVSRGGYAAAYAFISGCESRVTWQVKNIFQKRDFSEAKLRRQRAVLQTVGRWDEIECP